MLGKENIVHNRHWLDRRDIVSSVHDTVGRLGRRDTREGARSPVGSLGFVPRDSDFAAVNQDVERP